MAHSFLFLEDLGRGFIVLQGLGLAARDVGEGRQALRRERLTRDGVGLEVHPVIRDEGEHDLTPVYPVAAKHGARPDVAERRQQFEDEFNEFALPSHDAVMLPARRPYAIRAAR